MVKPRFPACLLLSGLLVLLIMLNQGSLTVHGAGGDDLRMVQLGYQTLDGDSDGANETISIHLAIDTSSSTTQKVYVETEVLQDGSRMDLLNSTFQVTGDQADRFFINWTTTEADHFTFELTLIGENGTRWDNRTLANVWLAIKGAVKPFTAVLAGEVRDSDNLARRLAGSTIRLTGLASPSQVYTFTTNTTGSYSGNNLEPGWYEYRISKPGYWDRHGGIYLNPDTSLGRSFSLVSKQAGRGLVWGRVTNQTGGAVLEASVVIWQGLPEIQTVDAAGYYESLVTPGSRSVIASGYGYRTYWSDDFSVVGLTQKRLDLSLEEVSSATNTYLEGQVREAGTDQGLAGVNVNLESKGARATSYETYTDGQGRWLLGVDQGGDYLLTVDRAGFAESQQTFTLPEGQSTDLGSTKLQPRPIAHIEGVNTGFADFAVRGETIQFQGSASGGSGSYDQFQWAYSKPGETGFQEIGTGSNLNQVLAGGLSSGSYTIRLRVQDRNGQWSEPDLRQLDLVGRPQVRISYDDGQPARYGQVTSLHVELLYSDFPLVEYAWEVYVGSVGGEPAVTAKNSDFDLDWRKHDLQPGEYTLRLRVTDSQGLESDWDTRNLKLESAGTDDGRPRLINGLQDTYGEGDWLNLQGDTQGENAEAFRWTIDAQEVGTDQNLDISLQELQDRSSIELHNGQQYSVVFSYQRADDHQWVESAEARFNYQSGPQPHEIFLPLLFIFIVLMLIRRRRRKRKARKLAKLKAIPRAPAPPRPAYTVPQESLYDAGQAPYVPPPRRPAGVAPQPGGFVRPAATRSRPVGQAPSKAQAPGTGNFGSFKGGGGQAPSKVQAPVFGQSLPAAGPVTAKPAQVEVKSAINYEKAHVVYKLKIENNTNKPLAEVKVKPFAPANLFKVDQEERTIGLIQPQQSQTATFKLRPRGECGNVSLQARVTYYDTGTNKYAEVEVKPRETAIICPMLKYEDVDEREWRKNVSKMLKVEETTDKIPMDGESLFSMVSDVFADLNLANVSMNVDRGRVFRGRAQFWAKGAVAAKGLGYAAQMEVIGGETRSKLILKAFAKGEDSLVGFYHCLLDEIEKRTSVRDYLDDGVTVQHIYGDMVAGGKVDIKDSVLQRTNIDTGGGGGSGGKRSGGGASGGAAGDAGPASSSNGAPPPDVKGDLVRGSKVVIEDSVVTRSHVSDGSDLDKGLDRLRDFVGDDEDK